MMKKTLSACLSVTLLGGLVSLGLPGAAHAADFTATVNVDTTTEYDLQEGLIGYNMHITNRAYQFTDPAFVDMVKDLNAKWGRWSAGTANDVFNVKTGQMPEERNAQMFDNRKLYYKYEWEREIASGKGYMDLVAYYEFLRKTGSRLTIVVNGFTSTPDEIADLVKFCQDNNILVDYWELSNEPYLFNGGTTALPKFYNSAVDYLNKLKPFRDAIKAVDPNAKTTVAYTPKGNNTWDTSILNYTAGAAVPWWDAIVWHTYEANDPDSSNGVTFDESMKNGNWLLPQLRSRIDNNYLTNSELNPTPIIQNELDVKVSGPLYNTQYNAIYNAEAMMRLSTVPKANNYMLTGTGGIPLWTIDAAVDYNDRVLDAYQKDQVFDSASVDHELYFKTAGLSNKLVNQAINNSTKRWNVSVSGGTTVATLSDTLNASTIPALYATAYKGNYNNNNKNYVLITNKSDKSHDVTIQMNGTNVNAAKTAYYTSSTNPQSGNSSSAPTAVSIQTASYTSTNPILVPPYSVMRVEWNRSDALTVPVPTRITSAETGAGNTVNLKWWPIDGATSYTVKYGTASGSYSSTVSAGTATQFTVSGLSANTVYYFAVTANNASGASGVSNEVKARTAIPAVPTATRAFGQRGNMAQVEWQSVPYATGYKVKYGTSPGVYTNTLDAGNRMGMNVEGLTSGTTYYFVVTAYNGKGESAASSELSAKPVLDLAYTPNNLQSAGGTSTSAKLTWEPSFVRAFKDYFEDGVATDTWTETKGTWAVIDHPSAQRDTKVYEVTSTGGLAQSNTGSASWQDYFVEANVEVNSWNADGTVSILGRYSDDNNYYRYVYDNSDQTFKLIKSVGGTFTTLATTTLASLQATSYFEPFDINNMHMIMEFVGSSIKCYIDSREILSATDSSLASGKIALAANKQQAMFDRVYAWVDNMTGSAGTYKIYRSTSPQSGYSVVASGLTSPTYTDTGLTPGTTYYYKVNAVKSGVESVENSDVLTVVK
ncbi:fibronectin type III domain-containing protein [Paenibacillus ferrarius]|uniref:fibronectin type III domain-containing protein n=1 Tax=Paenibacillus ferrarius TaxID=1469647 RepID=UPI003D2BF7D5